MLRRLALPLALLVVAAHGACSCEPEPVAEIICNFTLTARDGDRIDFGTVEENGGTRSGTIVLKNTGNQSLTALSATFTSNGGHYSLDIPEGFTLAPDQEEALVVIFAPTLRTTLNSELRITHPDLGAGGCPARELVLLGEGVEAQEPADAGVDAGDPDGGIVLDDAGFADGGTIPAPDGGVDFDPTSRWVAYGGFEEARAGFATVPLADGTVLAIGGWGEAGRALDTIERFDPVTGRSRIVATMALARAEPGAVALDANRVAIVGGRSSADGGVVVRTVEILDVAANTLSCPGSQAVAGVCSDNTRGFLPAGRVGPIVTRLNDNEIVVALGRAVDSDVEVAFAGGEILNIGTGAVTPVTGLIARTGEARLVDEDGSFLVVGGLAVSGGVLADGVQFSAALRSAGPAFTLAAPRAFASIARFESDRALLVGGHNAAGVVVGDAVLIDSVFGAAPTAAPLTTTIDARVSPDIAVLPGDIVIIAGGLDSVPGSDNDSVVPLRSAELLVPFGAGFARFAPDNDLAQGRVGGGVVVTGDSVNDDVVVTWLGGFGTAPRRTPHPHAEQYRLFTNDFSSFGLMGAGAAYAATAPANVVAIGGVDPHTGATSARSRAFDAVDGLFLDVSSLQAPRRDHSATAIAGNLVVVIGGRDSTGAVVSSASILNVGGNDAPLPVSLRRARAEHTATLLPGAPTKILLCGGVGAGGELLDSCEIFTAPTNPADDNTFATASFAVVDGRMATGRVGHSATLLDSGEVLLVGGGDVERAQVAADLFDPTEGEIVRTGVPLRARRLHAAVALGAGRVLLAGGEVFEGAVGPSRRAEVYVRATGIFVAVGDMEQARVQPAGFLLGDGNVLIAGGTRSLAEPGFPTVSVVESELYEAGDTGIGTFEAVEVPLSYGRSDVVGVDVFGRAVVVGGTHRDGVIRGGDERRSPQHFVDMLEAIEQE